MGWINRKAGLTTSSQTDLRPRKAFEAENAIRLEDRLVLGSLSPMPGLPENAEPAEAQSGLSPLPTASPSGTQSTPGTGHQDAPQAQQTPVVEEGDTSSQSSQPQSSQVESTSGTGLGSALADEAAVPNVSSASLPADLPASGVETLSEADTVPVSSVAPASQSAESSSETDVEDPGTGTAALSSALQNKDPGVLVDSETLANGYNWQASQIPWFDETSEPVVIRYDFRDQAGTTNEMTQEQIEVAEQALLAWTEATNGRIQWVRDTEAADSSIVNIGLGNLSAVGLTSTQGGTLGVSGTALTMVDGSQTVMGTIWLDHNEAWENTVGNGDVAGTVDLFTALSHEAGHIIGLDDSRRDPDSLMYSGYTREHTAEDVSRALQNAVFFPLTEATGEGITGYALHSLTMDADQLNQVEVQRLLERASSASTSNDAIIAIVDRNGTILGVRVEQGVLDQFAGNNDGLIFAIDGAIAKARTAAFFANNQAPLTSRTIQYISQSTITQREVEGNPSANVADPTLKGPGYVAPIGLGGHFPPDIFNVPPVDLFAIEHTNRDRIIKTGPDGIFGTADDIGRFNIDPSMIPLTDPLDPTSVKNLVAPLSYGVVSGAGTPEQYVGRGIATLPGGIPIVRDTNGDGSFDKVIGGIGVFFPGEDGYATHEQGFVAGIGQTATQRVNASRVLEAEYIAFAAVGGSPGAVKAGADGAVIGDINGIPPLDDIGLPFGNITLVGIQLPLFGDVAGVQGVRNLLKFARNNLAEGAGSGADQFVPSAGEGYGVPTGELVKTHGSANPNGLTQADVQQIIDSAVAAADVTRAAIRLNTVLQPGATTKMVIAITDLNGEVLGLYRMDDSTVFSIDVAVAKARNVSYFADATALQPQDQIAGVTPGTAFTSRTFRFIAEARFPDGVDNSPPPPMSILMDAAAANIDPTNGENLGAAAPNTVFQSALGYDSFNPGTNFHDTRNKDNQNGVVFFPGSTPLYKDGVLVGGLGISGDGVDQDDIVTFLAAQGFLPDGVATRADETFLSGVRLPYQKFNRNPFAINPDPLA